MVIPPSASERDPAKADEHGSGQRPSGAKPWRTEGLPGESGSDQPKRPSWWRLLGWFAAVYLVMFVITTVQDEVTDGGMVTVPYTEFTEQVEAENVEEVFARGDTIEGTLDSPATVPGEEDVEYTRFTTERPTFAQDDLLAELAEAGATVRATPVEQDRGCSGTC